MIAPLPDDEAERLAALQDHKILDTAPEEGFDDLVRLAAHVCGVPIAAVSLVDAHRQWFKSIVGLDVTETPRDMAFCAHTILQPDLFVVQDAQADPRFADNPLVTGTPGIRFYAGAPLVTADGHALGSLCVIDQRPRELSPTQQETLRALGRLASTQLGLARRLAEQEHLIAERDRAQEALRRSEARLAEAQQVAGIGSWEYDLGRDQFIWSAELFRLFEMDPAQGEPSLKTLTEHYHPDDFAHYSAVAQEAMRSGRDHEVDIRILRRDGSYRWAHIVGQDERDDAGDVVRLFGTLMDIHERKEAEITLHQERQFQEALLESLQEGIAACDAQGTLRLFNRASREFHGMAVEPLPPEMWAERFDLYCADGLTPMAAEDVPLFRALRGEDVTGVEMVIAPSGDTPRRSLIANGQQILSTDGEKLGAVVAMRDVTEERQAQQELARLAAIVESSEEAILAATLDGTLVSWNKGAERLYGYTASEMIGRNACVLAPQGQQSPFPDAITRLTRGETVTPMEVAHVRKDGSEFRAVLAFSPIWNTAGEIVGLSCIARDTTARAAAEQALRRSEARLAEAQRIAKVGSWEYNLIDGRVAWSGEMFRLLGRDPDLGVPDFETAMRYYHPEDAPTLKALVARAAQQGVGYELDLRGAPKTFPSGPTRWYRTTGEIITDASGRVAELTGTLADITEHKQAAEVLRESHRALHSSEARLAEAQRVAHIGSWEYDIASGSISWSEELFRLFEKDTAEGEPSAAELMDLYHPDDVQMHIDITNQAVRDGLPYEFDIRIRRRDGSVRWAHAVGQGERGAMGDVVRLFGTLMDIHERKTMEEARRESTERLRLSEARLVEAQQIARIGDWELDIASQRLHWSAEVFRLMEFDAASGEPSYEDVLMRYHPEDRAERDRIFAHSLITGEAYQCDLRLLLPSGTPRWCHLVGRPVRDAAGAVVRVTGTAMDVTERVASEERFRVLFERSSDAHLFFDDDGIIDCNAAAVALLRCEDKSHLLSLHPAVLSPEFQADGRASMEKCIEMDALARERGFHRFEWAHRKMDGEEFPVEVTLTPIILEHRPVMLVVWHDLTDRKQVEEAIRDHAIILEFQKGQLEAANRELASLATTDGLTGLTNHRAFQERLADEVRRAERYATPLSVVFLDVDHFKNYNDRHGHPAGDAVLRGVAGLLRKTARETDLVARYGGEEFVVVLPQTDGGTALAVAERIRTIIEGAPWPLHPITASFGVAALRQGVESGGDLIARADHALYQAKKEGRNRVALATIGGHMAQTEAQTPESDSIF